MLDPLSFDDFQEKCISQEGPQWTKLTHAQYDHYPYNLTGIIQSYHCNQQLYATGFLISSCLVLTSAHTFLFFMGKSYKTVDVKPAAFYINIIGHLDPLKACKVIGCKISPKYKECIQRTKQLRMRILQLNGSKKPENQKDIQKAQIKRETYRIKKESEKYDYALLKIQKMVERDRYARIVACNKDIQQVVGVGGYYRCNNQFDIYYHSKEIIFEQSGAYYPIDTESGQSGSPVSLHKSQKGQIIGIHKGFDNSRGLNTCTLITQQLISQLLQWAKQFRLESVNFIPYRYSPSSIFFVQEQKDLELLHSVQEEKQQLKTLVQQLKVQNQDLKRKIQEASNGHQLEIQTLNNKVKSLEQQIFKGLELIKKKDQQNSTLLKPEETINSANTEENQLHTEGLGDIQNPYNINFKTYGTLNKFTVKKLGQDKNHYIFAKSGEIPKNDISTFRIKQVKTHNRHIFTGIATKNAFGVANAPLYSFQCITYDSKYGQIWSNTHKRTGFRKIAEREVITLLIDTINWMIQWSIEAQPIIQVEIPPKLRTQALYLVVLMNWDQDTVEIQSKIDSGLSGQKQS